MKVLFSAVALVGGVIIALSSFPQIIKLFKTKSSKDLSLISYGSCCLGIFLVTFYSFYIKDIVFIILNVLGTIELLVINVLIVIYRRTDL